MNLTASLWTAVSHGTLKLPQIQVEIGVKTEVRLSWSRVPLSWIGSDEFKMCHHNVKFEDWIAIEWSSYLGSYSSTPDTFISRIGCPKSTIVAVAFHCAAPPGTWSKVDILGRSPVNLSFPLNLNSWLARFSVAGFTFPSALFRCLQVNIHFFQPPPFWFTPSTASSLAITSPLGAA
jgi:hypothetical protein